MKEVGVTGLQVDDLYTFDPEVIESLQPIYALFFLFKWVAPEGGESGDGGSDPELKHSGGTYQESETESDVRFARQFVNNSCATVAAINAVSTW